MSETDECYTPPEYITRARDVLGRIDTDPTSNEEANRIVRARVIYTAERSGLRARVKWRGCVWFNPPYSDPQPFVEKLLQEYDAGHCVAAIALLNARPGSAWFQMLARRAWRCEKRKRIRFYGPGSASKKKPKRAKRKGGKGSGFQDNVFFYLGPSPERFAAAFADLGEIVPPSITQRVTESVTRHGACVVCGRSLAGLRAHAVTCSRKCKQRAYRKRLSNEQASRQRSSLRSVA